MYKYVWHTTMALPPTVRQWYAQAPPPPPPVATGHAPARPTAHTLAAPGRGFRLALAPAPTTISGASYANSNRLAPKGATPQMKKSVSKLCVISPRRPGSVGSAMRSTGSRSCGGERGTCSPGDAWGPSAYRAGAGGLWSPFSQPLCAITSGCCFFTGPWTLVIECPVKECRDRRRRTGAAGPRAVNLWTRRRAARDLLAALWSGSSGRRGISMSSGGVVLVNISESGTGLRSRVMPWCPRRARKYSSFLSLHGLRRVAVFCRPLRPVFLVR